MRIGGWLGGKPTDSESLAEVVQAKRPRVPDQHPENAAAAGKLADRLLRLRVDAVCHEALEGRTGRVDHAESRVFSSGDAGGGGGDPLQHCIERELGTDRDAGLDERAEAVGFFRRGHVANRLRRKAAP